MHNNTKTNTLYLIIIGKKPQLEAFINNIKKDHYTITPIGYPSANKCLDLMKTLNNISDNSLLDSTTQKPVLADIGIEFAQCYLCKDFPDAENYYMLQVVIDQIEYYLLTFIKFQIDEDDTPEMIIDDWFQKNNNIKKSTKTITLTGEDANILVISAEIK